MLEQKNNYFTLKLGLSIPRIPYSRLYVHNDTVVAFGQPEKQILIEPVFAQFIQAASGKALYGFDVLLSS